MAGSERQRELRRRRHRKEKVGTFRRRTAKASVSEKQAIAAKIRKLTPGANEILRSLSIDD